MSQIKRAISMYSLQDQYARGYMDLEDIFKFLNEQEAGMELISDQMIKGTPYPSDEMLAKWDALVEKYQPTLVCNDIFINTGLYNNRTLTAKESTKLLIDEIKLANRLGFKMVRLVSNTPTEIIEPALPYAEKYNVILTLEVHAGASFDVSTTSGFIDIIRKTKSKFLGLTIDTGIFCRRHPRVSANHFREQGVNEELIKFVDDIFASGIDPRQYTIKARKENAIDQEMHIPKEVAKLCKGHVDVMYYLFAEGYEASPFTILDEHMPYIKHFHGKIFEMMDEDAEYSIPFDELIQYLDKKGYDGYIATEYEGNRFALEGEEIVEKEQVIKHQKMLRRLLG